MSESQIGLMRLQFWSDAIDSTFSGNPPEQPVAAELHKVRAPRPGLFGSPCWGVCRVILEKLIILYGKQENAFYQLVCSEL